MGTIKLTPRSELILLVRGDRILDSDQRIQYDIGVEIDNLPEYLSDQADQLSGAEAGG